MSRCARASDRQSGFQAGLWFLSPRAQGIAAAGEHSRLQLHAVPCRFADSDRKPAVRSRNQGLRQSTSRVRSVAARWQGSWTGKAESLRASASQSSRPEWPGADGLPGLPSPDVDGGELAICGAVDVSPKTCRGWHERGLKAVALTGLHVANSLRHAVCRLSREGPAI